MILWSESVDAAAIKVYSAKANNKLFSILSKCSDKINALETDKSMNVHV
jgi:hypothetical protein